MAEADTKDVRELRLEGAGLFLIVAFLGAGLVGAFFLGRWYERSSAPPVGLDQLASDPLANVVAPGEVEDVDADVGAFDTIAGSTQAEPQRQATPQPKPAEEPPATQTKPQAQPQAQPATQAPAAPEGSWYVQIAAFRDRSSADRVVGELDRAGYAVKVFSEDGAGGRLYRVRVGGFATRDQAATKAAELITKGYDGAFPKKVD